MDQLEPRFAQLTAAMNEGILHEDPLIGEVPVPQPGDDVIATLSAGLAAGGIRSRNTPLDSSLSLWRASTLESLQLRCAPEASSADIAEILGAWLALSEPTVAEPGGDRARIVRLPVTVRQAVIPLLEHGFAPATVTLAQRLTPQPDPAPHAVQIRNAVESDRDRMRELMRELVSTEIPFGAVRRRAPELSDTYADEAIGFGPGWTVVAEADGEVVGWASITPPAQCEWAAASVRTNPAAYLGVAIVSRSARSGGVGRAMVATLHAHAAAQGVDTVLLDASAQSPWSMPFWQRQGYRPLWTTWQRRYPEAP